MIAVVAAAETQQDLLQQLRMLTHPFFLMMRSLENAS
jgi:hypothetical protein